MNAVNSLSFHESVDINIIASVGTELKEKKMPLRVVYNGGARLREATAPIT